MSRSDLQGLGYDPSVLRVLKQAYAGMLVHLNVLRRESDTVPELLAIAAVTDELQSKLHSVQRRLDRIETHRFTQARLASIDAPPALAGADAQVRP